MRQTASRYHDFCYGHRVTNHESKCKHLHGHNGRVHFVCQADMLDDVGRVIDFSVIKDLLCNWVEEHWDHRFLVWMNDPLAHYLKEVDDTVQIVPFNPTAENMTDYLLNEVAPIQLRKTGVRCVSVTLEETRKCKATSSKD